MVNSKLVVEIHGQLKIGGGKKRVLLDWRENGNRRKVRNLCMASRLTKTTAASSQEIVEGRS